MNAKKLKELAEKNETAKRILSMVGDRRRNTVYTAFSGLRADLKKRDKKEVDRKDFDSTFQALEKAGAGKVQCSPNGVCQGFHWSVPIREVGQALKGTPDAPREKEVKAKPKTILRTGPSTKVPAAVLQAEKEEAIKPNVAVVSSDLPEKNPATIIILRKGKGAETFETDDAHAQQMISTLSH